MNGADILIAGCGDVGGALAERLRDAGHRVVGLRRRAGLLPAGIEPLAADLGEPLRAGQVVLLGSLVQTNWVAAGVRVVVRNDPLGEVRATFVAP